ncbi:multiubiquitin domain-containing protein [Phenylobacterium soli]|nr:multiubiquitin domain-containing protein [Phenylobacterium soli]
MSQPDDVPHHPKPKTYEYFVDNVRYTTDQPALTGAQIKAKVPDWPAGYGLLLDPPGEHGEERLIADDEVVRFDEGHGHLHFTRVPPASYGG